MRKFWLTMASVAVITVTAAVPAFAAGSCGATAMLAGKCAVPATKACQTAVCNTSSGASQCKTQVSPALLNCGALRNMSLDQILALFCQK